MHREYIAWESPTLGRKMELLWFGHGGEPMIWFPTSQGRFYQNEDFGLIGSVADLIEGGAIQVCCVDSVDAESFYATQKHPADRIRRHDQYDRYIANEIVPFARSKGHWAGRVATLGASFGAYHAANFGFRHPDLVDKVVAFSGKYDIHNFLGGYWDDLCYVHCPTAALLDGHRDRHRRDRQHPLRDHGHAADPGRERHSQPGLRLERPLWPRLAVVESPDPHLRPIATSAAWTSSSG
jgi:esterase/lipase superfamily enzyme